MSNIHSLSDYRGGGSNVPYRAAPSSSPSASSSGRSNFATLGSVRSTDNDYGAQPAGSGGYPEPAREGISFFRAPDLVPGVSPTLRQQCCPRMGWRYLTTAIALVDTVILVIELIVGSSKYGCAFDHNNQMGGPSTTALYCMGGKWTPDIHRGAVWRLLTPVFLHAGILHLAGNLWMLLRFGYVLETRWGWWRFGLVYLLSGIGASLWSAVLGYGTVSVGASGAIMGLMGADIAYLLYNYHEVPDVKVEAMFIAITIVLNFLFGLTQIGIDNYAHLGGLIMGFPLGVCFVPLVEKRDRETVWRMAAAALYGGLFFLFCLLLWAGNPSSGVIYFDYDCSQSANTCV